MTIEDNIKAQTCQYPKKGVKYISLLGESVEGETKVVQKKTCKTSVSDNISHLEPAAWLCVSEVKGVLQI